MALSTSDTCPHSLDAIQSRFHTKTHPHSLSKPKTPHLPPENEAFVYYNRSLYNCAIDSKPSWKNRFNDGLATPNSTSLNQPSPSDLKRKQSVPKQQTRTAFEDGSRIFAASKTEAAVARRLRRHICCGAAGGWVALVKNSWAKVDYKGAHAVARRTRLGHIVRTTCLEGTCCISTRGLVT